MLNDIDKELEKILIWIVVFYFCILFSSMLSLWKYFCLAKNALDMFEALKTNNWFYITSLLEEFSGMKMFVNFLIQKEVKYFFNSYFE